MSACKIGVPTCRHCHAMAGLIRTFLTDREKLNVLAIFHLIGSFRTYTEPPRFKRNPNVVYATNISNFAERLKNGNITKKFNFASTMITNVIKYKGGPPVYGKCNLFNQSLFYMFSNPMMNCGIKFLLLRIQL